MKTNKLPHFKSAAEEAKFWDTHSLADYVHEMKDVTDLFTFSPHLIDKIQKRARKKMIAIRLAQWEIEKSKEIAKRRHVPYQALIRHWIDEGLRREIAV
ncbi:MAG: hypothetical protein HYS58_00040 [Elusimicrobia bacterium]|nr:hypothetical protein [Elusimicrobiota bacterium]MBI4218122.1 hypothetical protein [Elusimicrobiota bacterium]